MRTVGFAPATDLDSQHAHSDQMKKSSALQVWPKNPDTMSIENDDHGYPRP